VAVSCKDDEPNEGIKSFNALADISGSPSLTAAKDKYNMVMMFSTDDGATFQEYPALSKGTQYWVKVVTRNGGDNPVQPGSCNAIDWSASTPAPDAVQGTMAQFTVARDNALIAKVSDTDYGPFDRSFWLGDIKGQETGACCGGGPPDALVFRADPSDPNAIIMSNFWGDGVDVEAKMVFTSTGKDSQVITIPAQTTSEGGSIATSVGTFDQCSQTGVIVSIPYTVGGKTYTFGYQFHR